MKSCWYAITCLLLAGPLYAQSGPLELLPRTEPLPAPEADFASGFDPPWYAWDAWTPQDWFNTDGWEKSVELGIDGAEGNSQTLSVRAGTKWQRKDDWSDLRIGLTYVKATADGRETKNNALFNLDHDWLFGESPWSVFAKFGIEYDEFKAFDFRLTGNAGVGYRFIKTKQTKLTGRFGTGASREIGGPDNRLVPEAVFGTDYEHRISKRQKFKLTMEYFPDWGDFRDYRLRTDMGWELVLDEASNLSMKLGVVDRYDSTPNGRKPNDLDYSLLLLWQL